jgi:hypothetical protein
MSTTFKMIRVTATATAMIEVVLLLTKEPISLLLVVYQTMGIMGRGIIKLSTTWV